MNVKKACISGVILVAAILVMNGTADAAGRISDEFYDAAMEVQAFLDARAYDQAISRLNAVQIAGGMSLLEQEYHLNLFAFAHYQMGDTEDAIAKYRRMIRLPGDFSDLRKQSLYTIAQLYMQLDEHEDAREFLDEFLKVESRPTSQAYKLYGQILYRQDKFEDAIAKLEQANLTADRNGKPMDESTWVLLAFCQMKAERYEDAAASNATILEFWPGESNLKNAIVGYMNAGDISRAVATIEKLVEDYPDTDAYNLIHAATLQQDVETIDRLAKSEDMLESVTVQGYTPLSLAARMGLRESIDTLLDLGASINGTGKDPSVAIYSAGLHERDDIIELLWNRGANPAVSEPGARSLASGLVTRNRLDILAPMIAGNSKFKTTGGAAALHRAALDGDEETFNAVLAMGVRLTNDSTTFDALLRAGTSGGSLSILRTMMASGADPNTLTENTNSPMAYAAANGRADIIEFFLASGMRPAAKGKADGTPMHAAARNGAVEAIRMLVDAGAPLDPVDASGVSPIMSAFRNNHYDLLPLFIEGRADVSRAWSNDQTMLSLAIDRDDLEVVRLLLDAGANVSGDSPASSMPLVNAIGSRNAEVVKWLIDAGLNINDPIYKGFDALDLATLDPDPRIVSMLLEAGAVPDGQDLELAGWTRSSVRSVLQNYGFKKKRSPDGEMWTKVDNSGQKRNVIVRMDTRTYGLMDLVTMISQSGMNSSFWLSGRNQ